MYILCLLLIIIHQLVIYDVFNQIFYQYELNKWFWQTDVNNK